MFLDELMKKYGKEGQATELLPVRSLPPQPAAPPPCGPAGPTRPARSWVCLLLWRMPRRRRRFCPAWCALPLRLRLPRPTAGRAAAGGAAHCAE